MSAARELAGVPAPIRSPRRLAAVAATDLLDTPPDEAFDRLTTLAAMLLSAPSAFVTIVDERRSFWKSCVGAAAASGLRQNAVEESFCQYVIASGEALLVGDAPNHPLTRDNPAVRQMGIGAWAGHPLHSPDGEVLGTFCVVDGAQREWTARDLQILQTLAQAASGEVALRMATRSAQLQSRRHELVNRAMAALNLRLEPAAELQALVRAVVPDLADLATVHLLVDPVPPGHPPDRPVHTDRFAVEAVEGIDGPPLEKNLRWDAGDPIYDVLAHGGLHVVGLAPADIAEWTHRDSADDALAAGMHRLALVPVVVDGLAVAVASFALFGDRPSWTAEDLGLLGEIAEYAAVALGHGMTYERSRHTALVLQRSLLSDPPAVDDLEICVHYQPAGRDEVGGDWYDVFEPRSGQVALAVGDVVGHDIVAAAAMGQLRGVLRTLTVEGSTDPGTVLDRLAAINERLAITTFATVLLARLDRSPTG
ncbi:MAG: GAF domain-containing SpoIIE family protein phosphatase [Sporichthyaceae bacterium]